MCPISYCDHSIWLWSTSSIKSYSQTETVAIPDKLSIGSQPCRSTFILFFGFNCISIIAIPGFTLPKAPEHWESVLLRSAFIFKDIFQNFIRYLNFTQWTFPHRRWYCCEWFWRQCWGYPDCKHIRVLQMVAVSSSQCRDCIPVLLLGTMPISVVVVSLSAAAWLEDDMQKAKTPLWRF